jgi:dihydrofolate synthase/folylpolyglutamate synthase
LDPATIVDDTTTGEPGRAWQDYLAAVARTDVIIEPSTPPGSKTLAEIREYAEMRMARLRRFLSFLGDPQDRFPIIHVGGTSGKGSTSTAIASILTASGYRTGLHTSPYLQVAAEKLQIDRQLIGGTRFRQLVDATLAEVDRWIDQGGEALTYGELWMALLARYFVEEQVDVAVVEVGAGGRFDLTNIVKPVLSVITSVGLDHTATLGSTIPEIAWHKAGIIKSSVPVISAVTDPVAQSVIETEAKQRGSTLVEVQLDKTYQLLDWTNSHVRWRELPANGSPPFLTAQPGRFQATNAATAVAAARALQKRGFTIPHEAMYDGLLVARIPGRLELIPGEQRIILDGAHNPEKMRALVAELSSIVSRNAGQRLIAVVGTLDSKEHRVMMELLVPEMHEIVLTTPNVYAKPGASTAALAESVKSTGFAGPIFAEVRPELAIAHAIERSDPERGDVILVTGSLFVVGDIRGTWYPAEQIVEQRSSWPRN